ncbi:MAG: MFS transporter [Candidatus Bathyarchaeia archaeon]
MLGLVSLFADVVYEGGRSVSGAYLYELNSPSLGPVLIGVGEFIGFSLRLIAGYFATIHQSSGIIWGLVLSGYAMTAISMPMLAFASTWALAVLLYMLDRIGKGLRAPARDLIVAEVSEGIGVGKGFGIHELLDQLGAFAGPLLVAFAIALWNYRVAFLLLAIPGAISISLTATTFILYPSLKSLRAKGGAIGFKGLEKSFWRYVFACGMLAVGFMHWAIASYYLKTRGALSDYEIGLVYSIAMLVDALIAVPLGLLFDKWRLRVLIMLPPLSIAFTLMIIYAPRELLFFSAIPWGVIMCSEESIMKASVALLVEPPKRPLAYGALGLFFGIFWALGGYIYTLLLAQPFYAVIYSAAINAISLYMYNSLAGRLKL